MDTWYVAQGNEEEFTVTIVDEEAAAITSYTGDEPLVAAVWTGRGQASLFAPGVTWDDPEAGTVTVAIRAAQSASVGAGPYFLKVTVTDAAGPHDVYLGLLQIGASPGPHVPPGVYCTYDDLVTYAPDSPRLQTLATDDTQFLPQRAKARAITEQWILKRYRPQAGRSRRYVTADSTAPGSYMQFAPPPEGALIPTTAQLQVQLAAGRLLVSEDVVKVNALLTAAVIYLGRPGANNPYHQLGELAMSDAMDLFGRTTIELDTNSDGQADLRIDRDVTFLT